MNAIEPFRLIIYPGRFMIARDLRDMGSTLNAGDEVRLNRYGPGIYATVESVSGGFHCVRQDDLCCLAACPQGQPDASELIV